MINDIEHDERQIRSYGCNGPNRKNEDRCKKHCRNAGYKNGVCSEFTNYRDCVCVGSDNTRSGSQFFFP